MLRRFGAVHLSVAVLALGAILVSVWQIEQGRAGLSPEIVTIGTTPATVYAPSGGPSGPAVVVAHGFSGSHQLMEPFAVTLAQAGYTAVAFDFLGHGRNPMPMTGDVTKEDGAGVALMAELDRVIGYAAALPGADGRVALLGHSMASDIVVRQAVADPRVVGTVAVSMFTRAVTAEAPRNLLVIVGGWERFLRAEALKAVALAAEGAEEGRTYGDFADGTARRAAVAEGVEHVGVLFSRTSLREARAWLDAVFGRVSPDAPVDGRGPWVLLLIGAIVLLAWPLSALLPKLADRPEGGLAWPGFLAIAVLPAILTPLILRPLPTAFLPVLVADYLAVHFLLYGLLTTAGLALVGALRGSRAPALVTLVAAFAVACYGVGALGATLDAYVSSFWPHAGRVWLIAVLFAGVLPYMLADEWLTRRAAPKWGAYALTKLCFLGSLAAAVALDLERLFFLIIILPVVLLFFLLYGLLSGWVGRATGQPLVAGLANAAAFAWALGVTFPLLAG
ncbi:MAG: alpha/beta fold hydrolase [Pseudomonadota bacterium]